MRIWALFTLALSLFSCSSKPPTPIEITLHVEWPGASAEMIEREAVQELEHSLSALAEVARIRSVSRNGHADVRAEFVRQTQEQAIRSITSVIADASTQLPVMVQPLTYTIPNAKTPQRFVLSSPSESTDDLDKITGIVRSRRERFPGVRNIDLCGEQTLELLIELDAARLRAFKSDPLTVMSTIIANEPAVTNIDQVASIVVKVVDDDNPISIQLSDIATLVLQPAPPSCFATVNRQSIVVISLWGNPADITATAHELFLTPAPVDVQFRDAAPPWPAGTWPPPASTLEQPIPFVVDPERAKQLSVELTDAESLALLAGIGAVLPNSGRHPAIRVRLEKLSAITVRARDGSEVELSRLVAPPAASELLRVNRLRVAR